MMGIFGSPINLVDVKGALDGVGDLAGKLRTAITGEISADKKAEIEVLTLQLDSAAQLAQTSINQAEASNPSLLVSGGRPFIIWVCGIGLAWKFIVEPTLLWILVITHSTITTLPKIDASELLPLVTTLLGLGGYRMYEKVKGVARS
jgi:hypothetical protein